MKIMSLLILSKKFDFLAKVIVFIKRGLPKKFLMFLITLEILLNVRELSPTLIWHGFSLAPTWGSCETLKIQCKIAGRARNDGING